MAAISKEGREKKKNEDGGFIYVYHLLAPFLTLLFSLCGTRSQTFADKYYKLAG